MNPFQLLMSVVFLAVLVAVYGKDIYAKLKAWLPNLPNRVTPGATPAAVSTGKEVVDDLVTVAGLRDRFEAAGCREGADTCSLLLKIIIDYKQPHAG
jgi:hypothetical protein